MTRRRRPRQCARGGAAGQSAQPPAQFIRRVSETLQCASFVPEPGKSEWRVTAALPDGRSYHIAGFATEEAAREWIRQGARNWLKSRLREDLKAVRYRIAPKYRSPDGRTWAGRGRRPNWLSRALEEGRALEEFLIPGGGRWTNPGDVN